jgi:DHA1 family bicyclomycin/chloramphenicol resistance-like MFS transporter
LKSTQSNKSLLILMLGALTALSPFSIDMYLPAFQKVAEDFHTSVAQVSLSLSSYFIGISVGQLIYGPLLDRYGRKSPLYAGLIIYILATLGCLFAHSIETLVALRLLQALGGCAANVAAMAMVRDLFTTKESSKVFSLLVLILGVSPLLAPTVGGAISAAFGWHAVFIILAIIAVLLLIASRLYLPDSYEPDHTVVLRFKPIAKSFLGILKEPQFATYTFAGAVAFSGLFVYVAGSPVIFLEIFKVKPQVYSWIFAALSVGFIGSSQLNILLIRKFKNEDIFFAALAGQVFTTAVFLIGALNGWWDVYGTIVLLFLLLCSIGLTNPNGAALALAPFSKNAGSAAALMGFLQMGAGAVASMFVGMFDAKTMLPIIIIFAGSSFIALVILVWGRRKIVTKFETQEGDAVVIAH